MNVPTLLSLCRLAAAPVAVAIALAGQRDAFFILVILSLFTDLVDGPIARMLHQDSHAGARLDTVADACTSLAAIFGLWLFEGARMRPDLAWLYLFLASYAAAALTALVKFGVLPAYHLFLSKTAAFSASMFFVWIFLFGYSREFFLLVLGLGTLANIESLTLTLRLKRFQSDIPSIYAARARRGVDDG